MTGGVRTFNASGDLVFSTADFSVLIIDVFTVASTDTGSQEYSATRASNVKVAQTQELEAVDIDNITVFNQMDVTVSLADGVWTVAWAPGVTVTAARNVTLFVLGY